MRTFDSTPTNKLKSCAFFNWDVPFSPGGCHSWHCLRRGFGFAARLSTRGIGNDRNRDRRQQSTMTRKWGLIREVWWWETIPDPQKPPSNMYGLVLQIPENLWGICLSVRYFKNSWASSSYHTDIGSSMIYGISMKSFDLTSFLRVPSSSLDGFLFLRLCKEKDVLNFGFVTQRRLAYFSIMSFASTLLPRPYIEKFTWVIC